MGKLFDDAQRNAGRLAECLDQAEALVADLKMRGRNTEVAGAIEADLRKRLKEAEALVDEARRNEAEQAAIESRLFDVLSGGDKARAKNAEKIGSALLREMAATLDRTGSKEVAVTAGIIYFKRAARKMRDPWFQRLADQM